MTPRAPLIAAATLCLVGAVPAPAGEACAAGTSEDGEEDAALLQHLGSRASAARDSPGVCYITACGCPEDEAMTSFPDRTVTWECRPDNAPMNSDWCQALQAQCEACDGVWCSMSPPPDESATPAPPSNESGEDPCADAGLTAASTVCRGAQGAGRQYCIEEEEVKCCVEQGGSTSECCADKNPVVQAQAVCQ